MAIENTPIQDEIDAIIRKGTNPVNSQWRCVVETPDEYVEPLKFFSIDIDRRYDEHFADYVLVDMVLPLGAFNHRIMPFKDDLHLRIARYPLPEQGEEIDEEIMNRRYRAIINFDSIDILASTNVPANTEQGGDLGDMIRVEFQLVDVALEQVRIHEVGGIYRDTKPGDVVRYILTALSKQLKLPSEDKIRGVDMVKADNQHIYSHVIIPHGMRPMDVPAYVQENWGGIYNAGIGCYLQEGLWYLWPEFNVQRFNKEKKTLTVYNIPPNRYRGIERTWRTTDYQVIIIATGESKHLDRSYHQQLNKGNAVRFTAGDRVWDGFGLTQNNKHYVNRPQNNTEHEPIEKKNYHVAPVSAVRISNNSFWQSSVVARRQGSFLTTTWENSEPEMIYPGMPVKFIYMDDNEVKEREGVVIRVHHYIHDDRKGPVAGRHICNSALTLFIKNEEEE